MVEGTVEPPCGTDAAHLGVAELEGGVAGLDAEGEAQVVLGVLVRAADARAAIERGEARQAVVHGHVVAREHAPAAAREQVIAAEQHVVEHEADVAFDVALGAHHARAAGAHFDGVALVDRTGDARHVVRDLGGAVDRQLREPSAPREVAIDPDVIAVGVRVEDVCDRDASGRGVGEHGVGVGTIDDGGGAGAQAHEQPNQVVLGSWDLVHLERAAARTKRRRGNADDVSHGASLPRAQSPVRDEPRGDAIKVRMATILIVPGLGGSGPRHWQSRWESADARCLRVEQESWDAPELDVWRAVLERAVTTVAGPLWLVAHSLGCLLVAHWAQRGSVERVRGALLVAPPDVESPERVPEVIRHFAPIPRAPLPFPSIVVASRDDSYACIDCARGLAAAWHARFVDVGACGHINADSELGDWPEGKRLLEQLVAGSGAGR